MIGLDTNVLVLESAAAVRGAIDATQGSGQFTDALLGHLGRAAGCDYTVTFDRRAAGLPGMRLL